MLFKELLDKKTQEIQDEFDHLFHNILENQSHVGDLLLVHINAFYNPEVHTWDNLEEKLSPYMFGPDKVGHSEILHHQFIGDYLAKNVSTQSYAEYEMQFNFSHERIAEIRSLERTHANTVQFEMLLYLKIWEADLFIKKLYQLTRLALGLDYDWHFLITESNRDKKATGKREYILRELVRDKLEKDYPTIYAVIKSSYKTQVRNSIAHSKYSILGRYIHLNNSIKEDRHSLIEVVSNEEWINMIHDTIIISSQVTRLDNKILDFYAIAAAQHGMSMEIRVNRHDPIVATEYHILKYRLEFRDWYWATNDKVSK